MYDVSTESSINVKRAQALPDVLNSDRSFVSLDLGSMHFLVVANSSQFCEPSLLLYFESVSCDVCSRRMNCGLKVWQGKMFVTKAQSRLPRRFWRIAH